MNKKEYKRLSRRELLELLIEESEKTEELERQLKEANDRLAARELKMEAAGSMAEAALSLNEVFEAADRACAQYVENIKELASRQSEINAQREAESRKTAKLIIEAAKKQAQSIFEERAQEQVAARAEATSSQAVYCDDRS